MTNYDFTGKSIKCETWEQMLHLAKLAEEQGVKKPNRIFWFNKKSFIDGCKYFIIKNKLGCLNYVCSSTNDNLIEIDYLNFLKALPIKTLEVYKCKHCPLYTKFQQYDFQYCAYPNEQQSCQMHVDMFANCPLKSKSITIKLKQNEPTGN